MNREEIYTILRTISVELAHSDPTLKVLPEKPDWAATLEELEIDLISAQDLLQQLETRIPTKSFRVPSGLIEKLQMFENLGEFCDYLLEKGFSKRANLEVVYVDDETENLFVFKRKFGKRLNLITFEDSTKALEYILKSANVGLVITDESMPVLSGTGLCDAVKKSKPDLKFILITGNPNHDGDLMYKALSKSRFYDFINKPVDFEIKGEEYFTMIQGLLEFNW